MPTHLYCLLPSGSDAAPPTELGARAIEVAGVVAWVGSTDDARLSREGRKAATRALEHDRVVGTALARGVTPVPATLADPYPTDDALRADLTARRDELSRSLERIDGMVEMAVLLAERDDAAPAHSDAAPGRAYLERIRDLPARLGSSGDEIDRRVGPLVAGAARRAGSDRLGLSHLVRRKDVDAYRSAVLGAVSGAIRMVVDGPRAPYSFAAFSPKIEVP
jgi:hypothetical protein